MKTMTRAGRRFLVALTVTSLLLCVAAAVESVRSFRRMDQIIWSGSTGGLTLELDSNRGGLSLVRIRNAYPVEADGAMHLNARAVATVPYYDDWGRPSTTHFRATQQPFTVVKPFKLLGRPAPKHHH